MGKRPQKHEYAKGQQPFSERLRGLRKGKSTRADLRARVFILTGRTVSFETLRAMERCNQPYNLPKRATTDLTPIECVAQSLGAPVGYLLGGFPRRQLEKSCFFDKD